MKTVTEDILPGRHTNHAGRKTTVQRLKDAKVDEGDIIQLTGHSTVSSLKQYDRASLERQNHMASILCRTETSTENSMASTTSNQNALTTTPFNAHDSQLSAAQGDSGYLTNVPSVLHGMFSGANLSGNITLTVNVYNTSGNISQR